MNITGIIAEYNPFHNGHAYQLEQARLRTNADYLVVVMNGDFMQRGLPAGWNKYTRAAMAVAHGADAVIELPVLYGTASAEFFATGGVRLLRQLSGVQSLCFGCETDQIELLKPIATHLSNEPENYRLRLNQLLSEGLSFPKARAQATCETLPNGAIPKEQLEFLLTQPNNILAIEYIKAILREQSDITPVACLRTDKGYHETSLNVSPNGLLSSSSESVSGNLNLSFASATAIRNVYNKQGMTSELEAVLPDTSILKLQNEYGVRAPISPEDFYPYLQYCLWRQDIELTDYLDISEDLANRIRSVYRPEFTYEQLVEAIVNKQYTYTRIYRCLLHIILDIRKSTMETQLSSNSMHYARLLAFRKDSSGLLRYWNENSEIPIINKVSDGLRKLRSQNCNLGVDLLEMDIASAHLYEQVAARRYGCTAYNDFTQGVIMV